MSIQPLSESLLLRADVFNTTPSIITLWCGAMPPKCEDTHYGYLMALFLSIATPVVILASGEVRYLRSHDEHGKVIMQCTVTTPGNGGDVIIDGVCGVNGGVVLTRGMEVKFTPFKTQVSSA